MLLNCCYNCNLIVVSEVQSFHRCESVPFPPLLTAIMPSCVACSVRFCSEVMMMPPLDLLDSKYGTCPTNGLRAVRAVRTPEERSSQVDFLLLLTPTSEPSCLIGECPEWPKQRSNAIHSFLIGPTEPHNSSNSQEQKHLSAFNHSQ